MNLNTTDKQEQPIQDSSELIEKGGCKKCRGEVLELIRLCNLSHMPEKLTEFIEQNVSTKEAREILMELLAERTKKTEILSTIPQNSPEDLMMEAAKARQTA